ncbi:MAG: glycosyltransferase [Actinomycetota bacterium]
MSPASMSIVVPAHDEEPIIEGFLRRLVDAADPGELDVVVVCNGCSDDTAAVARRIGPPVRVIETDIGHKPTALNLADDATDVFPRLYLDADVDIDLDAVRACARALDEGALAAAPRLLVDTSASSWPVRSYYRVWMELPWVQQGMVGSGVFAVSAEGRERFERFPDDGADDLFFSAQYAPDERRSVDATFSVQASPNARRLVRRRSRIVAANQLMADRVAALPGAPSTGLRSVVDLLRRRPALVPHAVSFLGITIAARLRARRMLARGEVAWEGDERRPTTTV